MFSAKIVKLFHMMGLKQYTETIAHEHITGDILLECTEDVLKSELHVDSRLHRIRVMKVADGSYSAKAILEGQGPYGDEDYL